ncbi:unnamed protein product [Lepidochelys olivacea]
MRPLDQEGGISCEGLDSVWSGAVTQATTGGQEEKRTEEEMALILAVAEAGILTPSSPVLYSIVPGQPLPPGTIPRPSHVPCPIAPASHLLLGPTPPIAPGQPLAPRTNSPTCAMPHCPWLTTHSWD